jgi:hypothetical protein
VRWFLARLGAALALGLCLAAVPSTHTSSAPEHAVPPPTSARAGNVAVGVPSASISPADGLPLVLELGHHYELAVHVWVAGRQPNAFATVTLIGASRSACVVKAVPAGTIATLHCTVEPTRLGVAGLHVSVVVAAADQAPIVAKFVHSVVATSHPVVATSHPVVATSHPVVATSHPVVATGSSE